VLVLSASASSKILHWKSHNFPKFKRTDFGHHYCPIMHVQRIELWDHTSLDAAAVYLKWPGERKNTWRCRVPWGQGHTVCGGQIFSTKSWTEVYIRTVRQYSDFHPTRTNYDVTLFCLRSPQDLIDNYKHEGIEIQGGLVSGIHIQHRSQSKGYIWKARTKAKVGYGDRVYLQCRQFRNWYGRKSIEVRWVDAPSSSAEWTFTKGNPDSDGWSTWKINLVTSYGTCYLTPEMKLGYHTELKIRPRGQPQALLDLNVVQTDVEPSQITTTIVMGVLVLLLALVVTFLRRKSGSVHEVSVEVSQQA
jgi:hypothetical protein